MRKSVHTAEYGVLRGRLVAVREGAGLSQRELARRMGVPHTWVAKVEAGERRIDLIELGWFCAGCGVEAGEVAREVLKDTGVGARAFGSSQTGMSVPPKRRGSRGSAAQRAAAKKGGVGRRAKGGNR